MEPGEEKRPEKLVVIRADDPSGTTALACSSLAEKLGNHQFWSGHLEKLMNEQKTLIHPKSYFATQNAGSIGQKYWNEGKVKWLRVLRKENQPTV